jgi:hypothetical protein
MFKLALSPKARGLLKLAREDRVAARKLMSDLDLDAQVALVCETPVAQRSELIDLSTQSEALIAQLPPAELCFTAKAIGLHDAGWLLEHTTAEQLVACFDLDVWNAGVPERAKLDEWLGALAHAGEATLLRAAHALDMELIVLEVRSRARVTLKPNGDDSWEPPDASHTLDGQFYLEPLRDDDDFADLLTFLRVLFQHDYWIYYRLLQGAQWELESDAEEWALRWRDGRLQDLGFPPYVDAKRVYAFVRPDQLGALQKPEELHAVGEWSLPVWMPQLPISRDQELALFRALAQLSPEERRPHAFAFMALANRVAMADELPLGDAESMPLALEKAARTASRGLEYVAQANGVALPEVLRRATLERLFRVGHQLDVRDDLTRPPRLRDEGDDDEGETAGADEEQSDA